MDTSRRALILGSILAGGVFAVGVGPPMCSMAMRRGSMDSKSPPPKRPAGTPAPLVEEDIAPVLKRLESWYDDHLDPALYQFNPPASDAALDALEQTVGIALPRAYRQLYSWHDGETDDCHGHIYGLPIIPLEWVEAEWKAWRQVEADFGGDRYKIPGGSWPEGAVDPAYLNEKWLPLTIDGSGNSIGLDFDPWPNGTVGQVILFGRDEDVKAVLAPSLGRFLEWIADLLESGNFRFDAVTGEQILRLFRLKDPAEDHFHEGARKLLGAPGPYL